MLENLLIAFPDATHGSWQPGQAFADPNAAAAGGDALVTELGPRALDLVIAGARRHRLELRAPRVEPRIVTADVIAARARDGEEVVVTWSAPHTLVGILAGGGSASLADMDGTPCTRRGQLTICETAEGSLVLALCGALFALARGQDVGQARARALAGVASMPWQQAEARLAHRVGTAMAERREV